jgi:inositol phosphorylceramide mannosyltransferase catalytic subunit
MRRGTLLLVLAAATILGGLVYLFSTLIALLFETGLQNAIQPAVLSALSRSSSSTLEDRRPIPKIIHQTWKNETIPEAWSIAQYSCQDLHPDYQYIVTPPLSDLNEIVVDRRVEPGFHKR